MNATGKLTLSNTVMNPLVCRHSLVVIWSLTIIVLVLTLSTVEAFASADAGDIGHDCLIEPFVISAVGSPTQGIISHLLVDRGATVKRGQSIAQLESTMEQAIIQQAEARTEMLGDMVTREADLELAQLDSARYSDLYAKGLAPAQQRDEALAREKIAKAAYVQALENQKLLLLELFRSRSALEQRKIKSPVDGVVVSQLVFPGELVYDNPIMKVAQLDPLRVEVVLPARLFGTIKAGDTANVHPEIETDKPYVARVDVVDPLLDSRSGTFGVRLILSNTDLNIPAGQKCRVNFDIGEVEEIDLFIPAVGRSGSNVTESVGLGAAMPPEAYHLSH